MCCNGLYLVAEAFRLDYKTVNSLIANVKKNFLNPQRKINPELRLPPEPVVTRWRTWLSAAVNYAKDVKKFCYFEFEPRRGNISTVA